MWAAAFGHAGLVQLLAARGAHLDARGSRAGRTALQLAAANDHSDVVEALIERGAQINAQDLEGASALMLAAEKGHTAIVQQLLRAGADPALRSHRGETALGFATMGGYTPVVRVLLAGQQNGAATELLEELSHEQLVMLVHQLAAALQVRSCCLLLGCWCCSGWTADTSRGNRPCRCRQC